jgi:RNA polymerase sigma factor (sigma-70 family)
VRTPATEPASAVDGNTARWFTEEVHAHDADLKAYLLRSFPDARNEVDDVVQESYLRIWKAKTAKPFECAKAFLFTIARHVTLDILRHNRASPIVVLPDLQSLAAAENRPTGAEMVSRNERTRLLVLGLKSLPLRAQQVVLLRKFEGFSQKEVASKLGISEKTVDQHLSRGLKRLGEFLRRHDICSVYER